MPTEEMEELEMAVFHAMMWTGALFSSEGPLRACTGREPLATLPWELARKWGGSRRKVEEREGKELEGRDRLKKRVNPTCLGHFHISICTCCPLVLPAAPLPPVCLSSFRPPFCWRSVLSIFSAVTDPFPAALLGPVPGCDQ